MIFIFLSPPTEGVPDLFRSFFILKKISTSSLLCFCFFPSMGAELFP